MKSKQFLSIAICGLLFTAVSCNTRSRVHSVLVDPGLGAYDYAAPGDTLEFKALNPSMPPFYVIFDAPSPCAETYLKVTKDKPGTCKVLKNSGFFNYGLSSQPPRAASKPQTCPQCQILITPPVRTIMPKNSAVPSPSPVSSINEKGSERISIKVACSGGTLSVPEEDVTNGDILVWADPGALGTDLTITLPAGVCEDTGDGQAVLKQLQPCILSATPPSYPHSYSYSVQMNGVSGCERPVTGTLNIEDPNSANTAK